MKKLLRFQFLFVQAVLLIFAAAIFVSAQAGRRSPASVDENGSTLPVVAMRENNLTDPIKIENIAFYENSVQQRIVNFKFDPTPSKIILLVDNSQTLRTDVTKMQDAAKNFAYEIYEGDQLFIAAYDEKAEIVQEWTDDAKKIETALGTFRKKGNPMLFDALHDVYEQILRPFLPGVSKTAVVIISDGLDRGSKNNFDKILGEYQAANVAVYALQIDDRTGGAYRRDQPKPEQVIAKLTEGTGGKVFSFDQAEAAAKAICDELRKNRYLLSYQPTSNGGYDARKLFLTGDAGILLRTKNAQPPTLK